MPDIRSVVKQMIEDGESEDVIDAVVKKLNSGSEIKSGLPDMSPELAPKDEYKGPDTFWGGVKKSLFQKAPGSQFSEAMQAGGKGLKGNLESIKDIPANLAYAGKDLLDFHLNPGQTSLRMAESLKQIPDIVKNAGNDPRTFGRTLGAFTTAPLVTEGLGLGAARIPRLRTPVSKALSSTGKFLAEPKGTVTHPVTPRMLGLRTLRKGVSKVGEQMQRSGEKMRMKASGVESVGEAASRNRPNPPPSEKVYAGGGEGATRNRPVRHDTPDRTLPDRNSEFTRPILESLNDRAARSPIGKELNHTGGVSTHADDIYPLDLNEPIPPRIDPNTPRLNKTKVLTPEEEFANSIQAARDKLDAPTSGVELPPPPYSLGAGQPSAQPTTSFPNPSKAATPPAKPKTAPPAIPAEQPVGPPKGAFEPSIDPAANFTPEDIALMKSQKAEVRAILEKMASGELVDPTTGEITTPPRTKGPWRQSEPEPDVNTNEFEFGPDEPGVDVDPAGPDVINDAGRQFASEVESSQRFPGDEAFDLGEISPGFRQTQSMPDWGSPELSAPRPVNPLRPEVPKGQQTNRSMFELSERRALENRIADQNIKGRQFAEEVSPGHEFDQDMMFTPDELRPAEVPEFTSPFENQYDPRISNLPPRADIPEGVGGDLHPDTNIDHASYLDSLNWQKEHNTPGVRPADLSEFVRQVTGKKVDVIGPTGEPLSRGLRPDIDVPKTIQPEEWGDWGGLEKDIPTLVPDESGSHVAAPRESQFSANASEEAGSFNVDNNPGTANDSPRLVKEDGTRVKPVGTKGEAFRVTGPDGKHLGDISITEKQIAEIQKHPNYSDMPREEVMKAIHEARLETILEEHGIPENAHSRVKVEPLDGRTKRVDPVEAKSQPKLPPPFSGSSDVGNYGAESITDYSGSGGAPIKTKPSAFKTSTKVTINPDVDFGPGGDIKPIIQEVRRLISDQAVDSKYRSLLPKIMRSELGPGETYRGKLERLIEEIQGELGPEEGAQRLAEMDAFNESFRNTTGAEALPDVPLLPKFSKIDRSQLQPSKLNSQLKPWISPRMQQQFPDIVKRRKSQYTKNGE